MSAGLVLTALVTRITCVCGSALRHVWFNFICVCVCEYVVYICLGVSVGLVCACVCLWIMYACVCVCVSSFYLGHIPGLNIIGVHVMHHCAVMHVGVFSPVIGCWCGLHSRPSCHVSREIFCTSVILSLTPVTTRFIVSSMVLFFINVHACIIR
jgi:hypothetical protein